MLKDKAFTASNSFFNTIYIYFKLNYYFLIYSLKGFIFLGLFPSFVALLRVLTKKDYLLVNSSLKDEYKKCFKEEFRCANKIGYIMVFLGLILTMNYRVLSQNIIEYNLLNVFSFYTLVLLYVVLLIWIFPNSAKYHKKIREYMFTSLIIGIIKLHYTVILILLLFLIAYVSLTYPALLLFFTWSVSGELISKVTGLCLNDIVD